MTGPLEALHKALARAEANRPQVGGFPYLAEVLRQSGVTRNVWSLPCCQGLFFFGETCIVMPGPMLLLEPCEVATFDPEALIQALRRDQAGLSTFPEFLDGAWKAGVVGYEVDFLARTVVYRGSKGDAYLEPYPAITLEA